MRTSRQAEGVSGRKIADGTLTRDRAGVIESTLKWRTWFWAAVWDCDGVSLCTQLYCEQSRRLMVMTGVRSMAAECTQKD